MLEQMVGNLTSIEEKMAMDVNVFKVRVGCWFNPG